MDHSLKDLSLVDCAPTESFDRFTRLASIFLDAPVSLVSIVEPERDRQFFTSAHGFNEPLAKFRQTPLSHSFCKHVKASGAPLIVDDARKHPLVRDNDAITALNVTAYLGVPIGEPGKAPLGALCVIDDKTRSWSDEDVRVLTDLADAVSDQIALNASVLACKTVKRSISRFGNIVEKAQHEVFTFAPDTLKFRDVNQGARENLGFTLKELRRLTPIDIKPEFSATQFDQMVEPLRTGELAQLRDKSEDFAALFNNAPDPMLIADGSRKIKIANSAYERLLDCSAKDLEGKSVCDIVPAEHRDELERELKDASPENPSFSLLRKVTVRGEPSMMMYSTYVQFKGKTPSKIFTIAKNVTELHQAKTEAEQRAKEAQQATEIRNKFLANMSHEVRTPINAIMGLFQLIEMADVPERQKKQAAVGLSASQQLLGQLVNVLELSKMEADAIQIKPKKTKIRPLAEQWVETAIASNHQLGKDIDVQLEFADEMPEVLTLDARRVTQIVDNLTDNALKFTKKGRVSIIVSPAESAKGKRAEHINICVADTGCGIPNTHKEAIFDRFLQVDSSETRENGGSGLGLTISRRIAELMGGTLELTAKTPSSLFATTMTLQLRT